MLASVHLRVPHFSPVLREVGNAIHAPPGIRKYRFLSHSSQNCAEWGTGALRFVVDKWATRLLRCCSNGLFTSREQRVERSQPPAQVLSRALTSQQPSGLP